MDDLPKQLIEHFKKTCTDIHEISSNTLFRYRIHNLTIGIFVNYEIKKAPIGLMDIYCCAIVDTKHINTLYLNASFSFEEHLNELRKYYKTAINNHRSHI